MNHTLATNEAVLAKVKDLVVANTGVEAETVTPEARFVDLGMDSLDALAMISDLEDEYGIKIPNAEVLKITTVGEAVNALQKHIR